MQSLKSTLIVMSPLFSMLFMMMGLLIPREVSSSLEQAVGMSLFFMSLACFMGLVPNYLAFRKVDIGSNAMLMGVGCLLLSLFSTPLVHASVQDPAAYQAYSSR